MPGAVGAAVSVKGYNELVRSFKKLGGELNAEVQQELKRVGEPVRREAETRAVSEIRNIGSSWSQMRLGVTSRYVYIAPRARRRGGPARPNLAVLLMGKAMWPAAKQHEPETRRRLDDMLGRLAGEEGF